MPSPIELKYIIETEKETGFEFPKIFKAKMQKENGGEFFAEDEWWFLFPFFDKSDKKRISRTCNHIVLETNKAREWSDFPENTFAIGKNGSGDLLVLIEKEPKKLGEEIYVWYHEEDKLIKVGENINDYEKDEFFNTEDIDTIVIKRQEERIKLNELILSDFIIKNIPKPWKLFRCVDKYEFQFGKKSEINITLIESLNHIDFRNEDFWKEQWVKLTELDDELDFEVVYNELDNFEMVIVKTKKWMPVLIWIKLKKTSKFWLLFRTESVRFKGDINELRNLLKNIEMK